MKEILRPILESEGVRLDERTYDTLERSYLLLLEWNEKINLTAITSPEEVAIKHYADSLIPLAYFKGKVCDVGAGAGFPSLPLAVANPELDVTMIDSVRKKTDYLCLAAQTLGLTNARAVHVRAEDYARGVGRESFDRVTARAVASLVTLAEYLLPLCKVGGKALIYKSGEVDEELEQAKYALSLLGGKVEKVERYAFSGVSRTLVIVEKVKPTPAKYPRSGNKPRLQPLIKE